MADPAHELTPRQARRIAVRAQLLAAGRPHHERFARTTVRKSTRRSAGKSAEPNT